MIRETISKKNLLVFLILTLTLAFTLMACGDTDKEVEDNYGAPAGDKVEVDPYYEMSDAELEALKKEAKVMNRDPENFYGTWVADDELAYDLYGGLIVTIEKNGKFTADVGGGEEIYHGTWTKTDEGIRFSSDLLSGTLYYGDTCQMTIDNSNWDYDEGESVVTLKKQK